jgi:hypothetical protein
MARNTKLTPELEAKICELLRSGNTYKTTCGVCLINEDTLYDWLRRGKAEKNSIYARFAQRVAAARATWDAVCMRTIQKAVVGGWFDAPVYDDDGNPIAEIDPVTGEVVRDGKGRPKMVMRSEFREPDARLALKMHQRANPRERGAVDREQQLPDPEAELEKAPTQKVDGQPEYQRISNSTLANAVKFLADAGVPIPGMKLIEEPQREKNGEVTEAEVVNSVPTDAKPAGGENGEKKKS